MSTRPIRRSTVGFSNGRIRFITTVAEIKAIVSMAQFEAKFDEQKIYVKADEATIRAMSSKRLLAKE